MCVFRFPYADFACPRGDGDGYSVAFSLRVISLVAYGIVSVCVVLVLLGGFWVGL